MISAEIKYVQQVLVWLYVYRTALNAPTDQAWRNTHTDSEAFPIKVSYRVQTTPTPSVLKVVD